MAVILTLGLMLGIRQPITDAERPALPRRCLLDVQLGAISWRESSSYQIAVTTLHPGRKGGGPPKAAWSDCRSKKEFSPREMLQTPPRNDPAEEIFRQTSMRIEPNMGTLLGRSGN